MEAVHLRPGEVILTWDVAGVLYCWPARSTGQATGSSASTHRHLLRGRPWPWPGRRAWRTSLRSRKGTRSFRSFGQPCGGGRVVYGAGRGRCGPHAGRDVIRMTSLARWVAVMVRAMHIPWVANVPLHPELKAKTQIPGIFVGTRGCADASLYRRFQQAGSPRGTCSRSSPPSSQPETPLGQFVQAWHSRHPHRRGNPGMARGQAQAVAEGPLDCTGASLCRRDKARDCGVAECVTAREPGRNRCSRRPTASAPLRLPGAAEAQRWAPVQLESSTWPPSTGNPLAVTCVAPEMARAGARWSAGPTTTGANHRPPTS